MFTPENYANSKGNSDCIGKTKKQNLKPTSELGLPKVDRRRQNPALTDWKEIVCSNTAAIHPANPTGVRNLQNHLLLHIPVSKLLSMLYTQNSNGRSSRRIYLASKTSPPNAKNIHSANFIYR